MNIHFPKSGLRVGGGRASKTSISKVGTPSTSNSAPASGDAGQTRPAVHSRSAGIDNSSPSAGGGGRTRCATHQRVAATEKSARKGGGEQASHAEEPRRRTPAAKSSGSAGRGGARDKPEPIRFVPLPSKSASRGGGAGLNFRDTRDQAAGTSKSRLRAGDPGPCSSDARKRAAGIDKSGLRPGVRGAARSTAPADEVRPHGNSGLRAGRGGAARKPATRGYLPLPAFFRDIPDDEPATRNTVSAPTSPAVDNSRRKAGARNAIPKAEPVPALHPGDNSGRKVGGGQANADTIPKRVAPAASNSGFRAGTREAVNDKATTSRSPSRETSRFQAGAGLPHGAAQPNDPQRTRENSARRGGDGQARTGSISSVSTPAVRNSGALASGDGADHNALTCRLPPHRSNPASGGEGSTRRGVNPRGRMSSPTIPRGDAGSSPALDVAVPGERAPGSKSPGRKARAGRASEGVEPYPHNPDLQPSGRKVGADRAGPAAEPLLRLPDPQNSGRKVGRSEARKDARPDMPSPAAHNSGSGRGNEAKPATCPKFGAPHCENPGLGRGDAATADKQPALEPLHRTHSPLIAEIVQLGRARRDWLKTRISIELRGMAICRRFVPGGDKDAAKALWRGIQGGEGPADLLFAVAPLLPPIASLREEETRVDRQMTKLAGNLPMAAWAKSIKGFGAAGLAKVVAECGDVGTYRNPSCVWKRLGLAVIDGERQRRVPGAAALDHGYNAERRSVMWNVGGAVIGGMGRGPRPLVGEDIEARTDLTEMQKLFVRRLRIEAERDPEKHAREPVLNKETGALKESFSAHAANRAKRYVEKRLLRNLWIAWRQNRADTALA